MIERSKQLLRLGNCPIGTVQIIGERRLCHIVCKKFRSNTVRPARTDSSVEPVPRYSEIRRLRGDKFRDCIEQRCLLLFLIHFPDSFSMIFML